ncbi:rho GTPase-activating protein 44 isoform X14 [Scyliorhinus canicula]|uniref:rho GTPase-activating protein 44 isoform X14 n=1 Tax=Scyliorhinus canicula TaxID=7830 RepID=UPI0018F485F3|nr:rho GTPase-activating protein 44 isoform X14 [Scyliorhinus canicula]
MSRFKMQFSDDSSNVPYSRLNWPSDEVLSADFPKIQYLIRFLEFIHYLGSIYKMMKKKLRAEKTEVLTEDLLQVEKRLELVKQVSHSTHKKLTACLQGQQGVDADKRSKKLPLTTLAQCLVEGSTILGEDTLLGKMLKMCGDTEDRLAQELILFELQIERDVIEPLFVLAEVDIPNIQKQRKHLAKLVLDMDSARTRWQQSSKSSGLSSNLQSSGAKADALREEMEEAANRVEICRDQLAADMYSFVAKEIDYANYFQTLIEVQAEYHRKSLVLLQSILPQIKAHQGRETWKPSQAQKAWIEKPSFGKPLGEHLAISGREIAFPIEACVTMLLECGMQEEGLFRVAASASKLKKLKASLDCGVLDVQEYSVDPHAVAGALKSYLRELPEPLMTFELYDEWIQASNIQEQDKRLQALWNACEKLPKANYNNFRYLIKFLAKLTEYQDANKMTPGNMAIVLGPNLLWTANEGSMTEMMTTVSIQIVGIIEPIIQHADWFFAGDIEFNVTGSYGSPVHINHNANYNSMPSPDIDHSDRKQHDQSRRPLSVATDNMMLEFYKKDGQKYMRSRSASCPTWLLRLRKIQSAMKGKELSPVIGQKGRPVSDHVTSSSSLQQSIATSQLSSEHSPHTLRKAAKKVAPIVSKIPFDQSTGQPSPASLSPTPPSTPSPYAANYPQTYTLPSSQTPPAAPSLSSPPSQTSTLTKSRPTLKPRQRPTLPPPQPPTTGLSGSSPQPLDHTILDNLSAGESMSTDIDNPDPSFVQSVELHDALYTESSDQICTNSVADSRIRADSDEESESTVL